MPKMPVLFVGHGSPMNAILDNNYSRNWKMIADRIPRPKAILSISAHWYTRGTYIMSNTNPKTIYDMYGFPPALYDITYEVPGAPEIASLSHSMISGKTDFDDSWGIDHGSWSVLVHMYPNRDIPVFQISIDSEAPPETHYRIGRELSALRDQGVLIMGSGNIVHNLRQVDWHKPGEGLDWAYEFDAFINENILSGNHDRILNYKDMGMIARMAVPTPDHFFPLLYVLGASNQNDEISVYNKSGELGSLTMTSYLFE